MSHPTPHRTPLRRVSQGSLHALSRSSNFPDAPHGLGFLTPVLAEFVDEMQTLQVNAEGIIALEKSLTKFNESFASWLYVQNMASLTLDWTQAPRQVSFELARQRAAEDARAALAAIEVASASAPPVLPPSLPEQSLLDTTILPDTTQADTTFAATSNSSKGTTATTKTVKKAVKRKPTAKEKRERGLAIEKIIQSLPLEFRGSDQTLRHQMETVLEALMDNTEKGFRASDLARAPDLKEARVHKCFLALTNRKLISKDANSGLYHWQGM